MQSTIKLLSTVLLLLEAVLHSGLCAEIPPRLYNSNRHVLRASSSESTYTTASATASTNADVATKLKLIEEQRERDPIPMEFYQQLDNVSDVSEFIERFVDKDSIDPKLGIQENLKRNVERAALVTPKQANCMPENTVVPLTPLNPSDDPKIVYYPKCTRVKRCGGCCGSDLMSCQPTETELINFEVTKFLYGDQTQVSGKEIVVVEQHKRCKCDCRIKEGDCKSYQVYRPELCRCTCTNDDALQKCLAQEHKYWDDTSCRCICRDSQSCTTGTLFDENQCKCVDTSGNGASDGSSSATLLDRRRFIVKAIPVEPLEPDNSTIYSL